MEPSEKPTQQTAPRDIVITNDSLDYGNIEAWTNVIASYTQKHPDHNVLIFYEGEQVMSMVSLFKKDIELNRHAFQMAVSATDGNWRDVPKLYRYLVEGASANFQQFIEKELHQVLKLF